MWKPKSLACCCAARSVVSTWKAIVARILPPVTITRLMPISTSRRQSLQPALGQLPPRGRHKDLLVGVLVTHLDVLRQGQRLAPVRRRRVGGGRGRLESRFAVGQLDLRRITLHQPVTRLGCQ